MEPRADSDDGTGNPQPTIVHLLPIMVSGYNKLLNRFLVLKRLIYNFKSFFFFGKLLNLWNLGQIVYSCVYYFGLVGHGLLELLCVLNVRLFDNFMVDYEVIFIIMITN
jgi:hypothetical protein